MPVTTPRQRDKPGRPLKNGTSTSWTARELDDAPKEVALTAVPEDVDTIAAREGWSVGDWERYYDQRHADGESGDICSECGDDAHPNLDELCAACAMASGDYEEGDLDLVDDEDDVTYGATIATSEGVVIAQQRHIDLTAGSYDRSIPGLDDDLAEAVETGQITLRRARTIQDGRA